MALIERDNIEHVRNDNPKIHKNVNRCTYSVYKIDEKKYIQFDTFGTSERANPKKSSQTIQFDSETAKHLVQIFKEERLIE
ncbi:hypothetical protein MsAg5_16200 [Methanosarcinaceae archaeon Ag5]|uniref:Methionyl-tRNA formyltransferase n=1 Tax=Methanolapillus africanus TaxID=3028297 RepID=A0AAE4MKQ1_9EURY|nr:hypothetical protein [Methanosarcinaceae archaeon Ag5]